MMTRMKTLSAVLAPAFLVSACGTDQVELGGVGVSRSALVQLQGSTSVPLLAGQSIPVGTISTSILGENLLVSYQTSGDWLLYEAHLWSGTSLSSMPQTNSGNPKLGNFPHISGDLGGVSDFSFLVPLSTFGLSSDMTECDPVTAHVVAHAVVKRPLADGSFQSETAYGAGTRLVQRGNWATWFSVVLNCTQDEPKLATCETAFAFAQDKATCFIGSDVIDTSRWGWYNGPLGPGNYSFDIYAAAGQCDLDKGVLVGTLNVSYDGDAANVTYTMLPGFTMDETHLYVGSEPLPRKNGSFTVAPGQFGYIHDLTDASSDSFTILGLEGNIYVVAHAVTCSSQWQAQ